MAKKHPGFTLSELIKHTADELRTASISGAEKPVMQFSGCELELSVTVGAEGGGGIRFWIVNASAKAKAETVSKIKLSFGSIPGESISYPAISQSNTADDADAGPPNPKLQPRSRS